MASSSTRKISRVSQARRPRGLHGGARAISFMALVAFWFNAALIPCCEALAAALPKHRIDTFQTAFAAPQAPEPGDSNSGHPPDGPQPCCGHSMYAGPAGVEVHAVPTSPPAFPEWFAIGASLTTGSTAADLASRESHPPSPRLFLRTRRLLI